MDLDKDIVKEFMDSYKSNMVTVKCTKCHHEAQAVGADAHSLCTWCMEGTMEPIA